MRASKAFVASLVALVLVAGVLLSGRDNQSAEPASDAYGKLPLSFVPNMGQADGRVRYQAQSAGLSAFFTDDRARIALGQGKRSTVLDLRFVGANPRAVPSATGRQDGTVNYFSNAHSHTDIPTYDAVRYRSLWPGIDMAFRGEGGRLKYELALAPGASAANVQLAYGGAESLAVTKKGDLRVRTANGAITDSRPVAYQRIDGRRVPVESQFALRGDTRYGFTLGAYDRSRPLVIDPGLEYSTFIGPGLSYGIEVDSGGHAYLSGFASLASFPTTVGAYDTTFNGPEAFVTKLSPDGSALVYSTFIGGSVGVPSEPTDNADYGFDIAVDADGNSYLTGWAYSADFPVTPGAYMSRPAFGGTFVARLNSTGNALLYSTFVGRGESTSGRIAIDPQGNAYVTGRTISSGAFPTTPGAFDTTSSGGSDTYLVKLNPAGTAALYSTFIGNGAGAGGVDVDSAGNAYVTGLSSVGFPTTPGAYDTTHAGNSDAYVAKLNPTGTALVYGTYIGGSGTDGGTDIVVDDSGAAYLTGAASTTYPTTPGAYETGQVGGSFITKLNPAGSALVYSTFTRASPTFTGIYNTNRLAVDDQGSAYLGGSVRVSTMPTTPGAVDTTLSGDADVFVQKLSPDGSQLRYSTYLGGIDLDESRDIGVDSNGDPYVIVQTSGSDYPTTPGAYDTTVEGGTAATKLDLGGRIIVRKDAAPDDPQNFNFQAGGGLSPTTFQLDDDADPMLSDTRTFDVAVGSGYSLAETQPAGWYLGQASCDDGSPVNNIDVTEGETVTCTFINAKTYPRPGGGTPLRVPLVPAFRVCNAPNATHASPLALPSCTPPAQGSTLLTTSTIGKGLGYARFDVQVGIPGTPTIDEADVAVTTSITDVRNASGGSDYEGQVLLTTRMLITDRANDPGGVASATVQSFEFSIPIDCQATLDTTTGSSCDLETTLDSLVPDFVKEGKRAVVSSTVRIRDAGPDGSVLPASGICPPTCGTGDERTFLDQGVFLP